LLLCLLLPASSSAEQKKPLSEYSDADLERLYKQWEESDPDSEPESTSWKSPQLDLTKVPDLTDPTLILQHSSRGQPVPLIVRIAGAEGRDSVWLENLSRNWQLEMFNAHMETTRRVVEDGTVQLIALDGSQVVKVREYLLAQPNCYSVTIEGHTVLGRGAPAAEVAAAAAAKAKKTEL
ncbi:hypothetical protein BOX15_Mlig011032g2, partial [Macrostomum lignano]